MRVFKRKPTDTADDLTAARSELDRITARLFEVNGQRDAALLDENAAAVDKADAEASTLRTNRDRAQRRIALLEDRGAAELRQRQADAQASLIERVEKLFAARGAAGADLAEHLAAAEAARQKILAANVAISSAWPFDGVDLSVCLLGHSPFATAIGFELYRLSAVENRPDAAFPGAVAEFVTDPRPTSVKPLVDRLREGADYGTQKMRGAPVRALPSPEITPAPAAGFAAPKAETATDQSTTPAVMSEAPRPEPEYLFRVRFQHLQTREERVEEVLFTPALVEESHLDGIGPVGARGAEIAVRVATERMPPEYAVLGKPVFDMARLTASMNAA